MNTHLHILEGYANLLRLYPSEERLRSQTRHLLELFFTRIMTPDGHLGLFFDETWHDRHPGDISFGHDIEASWLLFRTAQTLGDDELLGRARSCCARIAEAALEGYRPDGSMIYERHADGSIDGERHWWVQAETVIGLYYLYRYFGRAEAIEDSMRTWKYIRTHLIDREGGEWWWSILPDGTVNRRNDKAGFWKCPYHNARMCMEVTTLIEKGGRPSRRTGRRRSDETHERGRPQDGDRTITGHMRPEGIPLGSRAFPPACLIQRLFGSGPAGADPAVTGTQKALQDNSVFLSKLYPSAEKTVSSAAGPGLHDPLSAGQQMCILPRYSRRQRQPPAPPFRILNLDGDGRSRSRIGHLDPYATAAGLVMRFRAAGLSAPEPPLRSTR